jgi:hypothetical protein
MAEKIERTERIWPQDIGVTPRRVNFRLFKAFFERSEARSREENASK